MMGLLSEALPKDEVETVQAFLDGFAAEHGVAFTSLRTSAFGRDRLVNVVMQVPGEWTVDASHDYADEVEVGIAAALGHAETIVHIEPLGHHTKTGPRAV